MPLGIGSWEIVLLLLVLVLLFGSSQLPKLGRQLGRGARQARQELEDVKRSFDVDGEQQAAPAQPPGDPD